MTRLMYKIVFIYFYSFNISSLIRKTRFMPQLSLSLRLLLLCGCLFLLFWCRNTTPEACYTSRGCTEGSCSLISNLVLFILSTHELGPGLGWALLIESSALSPRAKHSSVIERGSWWILVRDIISFFLVICKEVKELLVSADLNDSDLKIIPRLGENLLDIALMKAKCLLMNVSTIWTQERAKRNVAMRAAIPLAVDTEGIVTIILNLSLEVGTGLWRLWVTIHGRRAGWGCCHEIGLNHSWVSSWWWASVCHLFTFLK